MDIKVTITKVLKDSEWGFSDLINGLPLDEITIPMVRELIEEDTSEIILEGVWKIEKAD